VISPHAFVEMNPEVVTALNFALKYLRSGNFGTAKNALNQIHKKFPNNIEILKLLGTTLALGGEYQEGLNLIEKAIKYSPNYGALYLCRGNILSQLNSFDEALASYEIALKLEPDNWEIHNNKGNVFQKLGEYQKAVLAYEVALRCGGDSCSILSNVGNALQKLKNFDLSIQAYDAALKQNLNDYEVLSNKGNSLVSLEDFDAAKQAFLTAITLSPDYSDAHLNLANLYLTQFNFELGWKEYEWRFSASEGSQLIREFDLPVWSGSNINSLLVVGEQGVGDQILHSSMLKELGSVAKKITVVLDGKLISIFSRSFPGYHFFSKSSDIDVCTFDAYIPMGSLGKYRRGEINAFENQSPFILENKKRTNALLESLMPIDKKIIGISWRSSNKKIGTDKSIRLNELLPIFKIDKFSFINLQYGETRLEQDDLKNSDNISIETIKDLNLYDDVDGLLSAIALCDIVVTTSNTTAHLAGAIGKETLLLLPKMVGKFWYWQDLNNISLWYPSVRVFKQEKQGEWSEPIQAARAYLENRFAI
jgi:Tfp pilus assembly protein PilF